MKLEKYIRRKLKKVQFLKQVTHGNYGKVIKPIIVYKKVFKTKLNINDYIYTKIISLKLPVGTIIRTPFTLYISSRGCPEYNKCRANQAISLGEGKSYFDNTFYYKKNKLVKPDKKFEFQRAEECSNGIHFFFTKQEAKNYPM